MSTIMLAELQKAFSINTEQLVQLRNGEFPVGVKRKMIAISFLFILVGIAFGLGGLAVLLSSSTLVDYLASALFFGVAFLASYVGYTNWQAILEDDIEIVKSKIKIRRRSRSWNLILDDKTMFVSNKSRSELLQSDRVYVIYFLRRGAQLIMIEPAE